MSLADDSVRMEIESKIAFLERANAELSDVVYRQQQDLQAIQLKLRTLAERFESISAEERRRSPEEERPPHY